jgi:hypothetical protein
MSWVRVRRDMPCPICGRPDWCLIASDGDAAICARVESPYRRGDAGYFHRLVGTVPVVRRSVQIKQERACAAEIPVLAEQYRQAMTAEQYLSLSRELGVSAKSLIMLSTGFDGEAFTFPMRNAEGHVIGIRRRFPNGKKICVTGSQNGLFIPDERTGINPLLITEGNSDCAAALDFGFDAIGRPSCCGGVDLIRRYIHKLGYSRVIVIPDNDTKVDGTNPGLAGGYKLARALRLYCPDIRVVVPPAEYNDLRCWAYLSLTLSDLQDRIEAAPKIKMEVGV